MCQFGAWEPLLNGMAPANGVPNSNLLGYLPCERLTPEGIQKISNIIFPDGNDMQSRLKWCPELVARVSGTLKTMDSKFKMSVGVPGHGTNTALLGWTLVREAGQTPGQRNANRIVKYSGVVLSSAAFGSSQSNQVQTFAMRRQRSDHARGLCYTRANLTALDGWPQTINSNFQMVAPFLPTIGVDLAELRTVKHSSVTSAGPRDDIITVWTRRNYLVKKDKF